METLVRCPCGGAQVDRLHEGPAAAVGQVAEFTGHLEAHVAAGGLVGRITPEALRGCLDQVKALLAEWQVGVGGGHV